MPGTLGAGGFPGFGGSGSTNGNVGAFGVSGSYGGIGSAGAAGLAGSSGTAGTYDLGPTIYGAPDIDLYYPVATFTPLPLNTPSEFLATISDNPGGSNLLSVHPVWFEYSTGPNTWSAPIYGTHGYNTVYFAYLTLPNNFDYAVRAITEDNAGNFAVSVTYYAQPPIHESPFNNGSMAIAPGKLFGTTSDNGTSGVGTVFEVVPASGAVTTLASFSGTNGQSPQSGLVEDNNGNFFGATQSGGAYGYGTVFEIAAGTTAITTLASFNNTNGADPSASLTLDSSGDLFGTTTSGGTYGNGTVSRSCRAARATPSTPSPVRRRSRPADHYRQRS